MMKRMLFGTALWACAAVAMAGAPASVRKQVEMSMLVTGTIDIQPDGSVGAHALDQASMLPPGVVGLIGDAVPGWQFEPVLVEGKAVKARARMSLRMVAKPQDGGNFSVGIRSASFGNEGGVPEETVTAATLSPPSYPEQAFHSGMSGTVYLVLRVGRTGKVEDSVAEQVNLTVMSNEPQMRRAREVLSRAALVAARYWVFRVPTRGEEVDAPFWSVRVPVDFSLYQKALPKYGKWQAYIPGPQQAAAWVKDQADSASPDAFVAGGVHHVGKGPRLLTPLG